MTLYICDHKTTACVDGECRHSIPHWERECRFATSCHFTGDKAVRCIPVDNSPETEGKP